MNLVSKITNGLLLASVCVYGVYADPIPKDKVALGKIDDTICGINVTTGNLRATEVIFGKGRFLSKDELTKAYGWNRAGLNIKIFYSSDDGSIKRLDVKGTDTTGVCKTGRGLQLGQSLNDVRMLYGHFYSESAAPDGTTAAIVTWSENEDLFINMWFKRGSLRLSKIEIQYMLE